MNGMNKLIQLNAEINRLQSLINDEEYQGDKYTLYKEITAISAKRNQMNQILEQGNAKED